MQTLQDLVDSLCRRLKCAVAIDDRPLRMLVHSSIYGHLDRARIARMLSPDRDPTPEVREYVRSFRPAASAMPVRIPARPDIGVESRIFAAIRYKGEHLGSLLVFDPDYRLGENELPMIADAARAAAEIIRRERLLWKPDRTREHELLAALLSDDGESRETAVQQIIEDGLLEAPAEFACLTATIAGGLDQSERNVLLSRFVEEFRRPGSALATFKGTQAILLVSSEDPRLRREGPTRFAEAMLAALHPDEEGAGGRVAVGSLQPRLELARVSLHQAEQALHLAETVPGLGTVIEWQSLGVYRMLLQLAGAGPEGALDERLLELVTQHPVLADTLECFLDCAGHSLETARRLYIHRATLHYRLRRIEEITGFSLDSGEDRLALHLGLKLAALSGRRRPAGSPAEMEIAI